MGANPYREQVMKIYQQYNPTKIGEVEKILLKYKGAESTLLAKLAKK